MRWRKFASPAIADFRLRRKPARSTLPVARKYGCSRFRGSENMFSLPRCGKSAPGKTLERPQARSFCKWSPPIIARFCSKNRKKWAATISRRSQRRSGVEHRMSLIYLGGVARGRFQREPFCGTGFDHSAKLFGLYPRKGTIAWAAMPTW